MHAPQAAHGEAHEAAHSPRAGRPLGNGAPSAQHESAEAAAAGASAHFYTAPDQKRAGYSTTAASTSANADASDTAVVDAFPVLSATAAPASAGVPQAAGPGQKPHAERRRPEANSPHEGWETVEDPAQRSHQGDDLGPSGASGPEGH